MNTITIDKYLKGDRGIWSVVILLVLFSAVESYSSPLNLAARIKGGETLYFFIGHLKNLIAGILVIVFFQLFNFKYLSKLSQIGIWIAVTLLLVTLLFAPERNSAQRWIMGFQPSDLAKIVLVILMARNISKAKDKIKNFKEGLLPLLLPVGLVFLLIFPQDLSTAMLILAVCVMMLFVGGARIQHLLLLFGGAIAVFTLVIALNSIPEKPFLPRVETWKNRLMGYSGDNTHNYDQSHVAKLAVANGSLFGLGPGNGKIKRGLYSAQSDYMYATVIEEYGSILGGLGLLILYLIFLFRSLRIMFKTESVFGGYVVFGLSTLLVFQALIHMGVSVNLLPVTGQTLPIMSMGGTSILFTCVSIGIILNVSRTVYTDSEEDEL